MLLSNLYHNDVIYSDDLILEGIYIKPGRKVMGSNPNMAIEWETLREHEGGEQRNPNKGKERDWMKK